MGITTTYVYDALNRVTGRTYTNDPQSTPAVSYKYDNQTLPSGAPTFSVGSSIGRLVAVTYGTGSAGNYTGYDQLGRVNVSYQQTDTINYGFGYGYNLASQMTSETYPSGRQVITEYDSAGRAAGIRGAAVYYAGATASDATNRIQYAPQGAVSVMKLGNGKWEHTNFNNRLQPTQIGLGTSGTDSSVMKLDYGYGTTTTNNGNVMSQIITSPSLTVNQCYGYDSLNRLTSAEEKSAGTACSGRQQWNQAFIYDRFGNRNFDQATTSNVLGPNPTISQSTNRFGSGQNYGYDFAGNLTSDPATNTNGIVYDAENRQTQYTKSQQATNSYYYDGDGHRIKKIDSSGTTVFVYDAGGQLIAEYTAGNPSSGGTSYLTSDHLGSTRLVIKSDGTTTTTTRHDFLPFGEEIQAGIGGRTTGQGYVADTVRQKFTQKERDIESGLDYFGARYYSSAQGRFTSVDPSMVSARTVNPQTWNRFLYVINNPLRYVDPSGMQEKDAWSQLNGDEQQAIRGKLIHGTVTENGQKRRETDQEAFNRLAQRSTNGSAEQVTQFVTGIQNFIDNAGGHENSTVWQAINHIEKGWVGANNSVGIEISTDRGFLETLRNSGEYDVDRGYEKANFMADHLHSARFITGSDPLATSMHLVQERGQEPATIYSDPRFFVHWDPASVAYRAKWWLKPVTPLVDAVNGVSHEFSHPSATETRRQLTLQHIVPKGER